MAIQKLYALWVLGSVWTNLSDAASPKPSLRGAAKESQNNATQGVMGEDDVTGGFTMEELLADNETLSRLVEDMELEEATGQSWLPTEEEPENYSSLAEGEELDKDDEGSLVEDDDDDNHDEDQDEDDDQFKYADQNSSQHVELSEPEHETQVGPAEPAVGNDSRAELSMQSHGWFSIWYGGFGGQKRPRRRCPRGTFIKSMNVVTGNSPHNPGIIRIQQTICSNGRRLVADGGRAHGASTTFFSHRGFREAHIFSGSSIRGLCMGGKCAGADGNKFKVKCRKGRLISGYRTRIGSAVNAIKFLCRKHPANNRRRRRGDGRRRRRHGDRRRGGDRRRSERRRRSG
jgi:hypothetical protein